MTVCTCLLAICYGECSLAWAHFWAHWVESAGHLWLQLLLLLLRLCRRGNTEHSMIAKLSMVLSQRLAQKCGAIKFTTMGRRGSVGFLA
jgi:hypothetical protein